MMSNGLSQDLITRGAKMQRWVGSSWASYDPFGSLRASSCRKHGDSWHPFQPFVSPNELPETGWRSTQLLSLKAKPIKGLQIILNSLCVCWNELCYLTSENQSMEDTFAIDTFRRRSQHQAFSSLHASSCRKHGDSWHPFQPLVSPNELPETGWSTQLLSLKARPIKGLTIHTDQIIANSLCVCLNKLCHLTSENQSMGDPFAIDNSKEGLSTKHLARCTPAVAGNMEALDIHSNRSYL